MARRQIPLRPEMAAASIVSRHYGLDVAFAEHLRLRELNGQTVRLPGLRHETSDQTFFLAFAQVRSGDPRRLRAETSDLTFLAFVLVTL